MGHRTEFPTNSGRHYRAGAQAWTPEVPSQASPGERTGHNSRPGMRPATRGGNAEGHLAGELPAVPPPRRLRVEPGSDAAGYPASRGELPLQAASQTGRSHPGGSSAKSETASEAEQAPRRQRVSFSEMEPAGVPEEPAEPGPPAAAVGANSAVDSASDAEPEQEPVNGLGMFDLGSVPASVTPPSTWRRAAWFAAASSGGVMGLLFAGTFLLGQQPDQPQASEHWTYLNRRGGSPLVDRGDLLGPTNRVPPPVESSTTSTRARQQDPSTSGRTSTSGSARSATSSGTASTPPRQASRTGTPAPSASSGASASNSATRTAAPTTTRIPQKPPPSPPESTVTNPRRAVTPSPYDWREMARVSNDYLNTVTEDPQQARQYTTGELRGKGADGLRRKYARIAYFEVRKIAVDENEGTTVNTVKAVYKDGHTEIQKHTLTFAENGKISQASP